MPEAWMPGADRDPRDWACYTMARNTPSCRAVLHWTASPKSASPKSQADYMHQGSGSTGYHLLVPAENNGYRPLQLRPAGCGAGSLNNTGDLTTSPNKQGTVLIQVSMVCTTGDDPFVRGAGPWWPQVLDWLDSWGVPRQFVAGDWNADAVMSTSQWYSAADGYTAHKQVPEVPGVVRKQDPGPVDPAVLFGGEPGTPPPSSSTFALDFSGSGSMSLRMVKRTSPLMSGTDVKSWQRLLADRGNSPGSIDGQYGDKSKSACVAFQSARGLGSDGIIGPKTGERLLEG